MVAKSRLTELQHRVLRGVAGMQPTWVLTGGAALAGFHLGHRTTRDLDLFFPGLLTLERAGPAVLERLALQGTASALQTTPTFRRLAVDAGGERVVVDLVADPTPRLEDPLEVEPGVLIDTVHEILVNKLGALLSRSEPRDLEDLRALVEAGGDLARAVADAPKKDAGFSPITLGWLLSRFELTRAEELGFDRPRLDSFRRELMTFLAREVPPPDKSR